MRPRGLRKKAVSMPKLSTKAAGELRKGPTRQGVGHQAHLQQLVMYIVKLCIVEAHWEFRHT